MGRIRSPALTEISGIAESASSPGVFFVHNDSGDSPRFFAIDGAGRILAEISLPSVSVLIDAEDIALGPAPGGRHFLYLGDIGNNFARGALGIPRRKAVLYRVPEPQLSLDTLGLQLRVTEAFPIVLSFPGPAHDAEAFFIDPLTGDLVLITKEDDGRSLIFTASASELAAGATTLAQVGQLNFGKPPLPGNMYATAASITQSGRSILLRSYSSVFLFERSPTESVWQALQRSPRQVAGPALPQAEAIGFSHNDTAFVTLSEGLSPVLWCVGL